jgi:hypothetical protein
LGVSFVARNVTKSLTRDPVEDVKYADEHLCLAMNETAPDPEGIVVKFSASDRYPFNAIQTIENAMKNAGYSRESVDRFVTESSQAETTDSVVEIASKYDIEVEW